MALSTADKNKTWNVTIGGQPRIARWDPATQNWFQDWGVGVGRVIIDPATQEGAEFTPSAPLDA